MARTGYAGARDRIKALAKTKPVERRFRRLSQRAPERTRKALASAVAWWHGQAVRRIPVRAAIGTYARTGRGQLRKRTQPYVTKGREEVRGGIRSMADYAWWLMAGTRYIAGGDVMRWAHGQPLITDWPAKRLGGAPRGAMPIVIPWLREARDRFVAGLARTIAR